MTQTSKNVLAVLLVITMMISLAGTMTAILVLANYGAYESAPIGSQNLDESSAKVSVYLPSQPVEITGRVTLNLQSSKEGG